MVRNSYTVFRLSSYDLIDETAVLMEISSCMTVRLYNKPNQTENENVDKKTRRLSRCNENGCSFTRLSSKIPQSVWLINYSYVLSYFKIKAIWRTIALS